ncbi:MAG: potassium channel family protein [Tunicatimonas sp.]
MIEHVFLLVLGILIVGIAVSDFAVTAFVPTGEGKITAFIGRFCFKALMTLAGKEGNHRILNYIGLFCIFLTIFTWTLLLWTGFSCIYISDPNSILVGSDKSPTDVFEKIYHVGYTLSTLGIGDYVPGNNFWRVFTSFVSFVGLVTVTMSITYLVPVISNAIQKRSLSLQISSLGEAPEQIVINGFNGKDFSDLSNILSDLSAGIFLYTQNHVAYPILHHMHSNNPSENVVLKLVALDEALTIFLYHIPEDKRPNLIEVQSVRRAITAYLKTITYMEPTDEAPPRPRFEMIEEFTGLKLKRTQPPHIDELYEALDKRRKLLYADLQMDGWQWADMHGEKYITDLDVNYNNELLKT